VTFDFEHGMTAGSLELSRIDKGNSLGKQPVTYAIASDSVDASGKKAGHLIRTDFDGASGKKVGDGKRGWYVTDKFRLGAGAVAFEGAGAGGRVRICHGRKCEEVRPNLKSTTMKTFTIPADKLAKWVGKEVVLQVQDFGRRGWGHFALDNLKVPVME
jgi:hypothetical protein